MVLSYDAYNETLEKQKEKDNQISNLQNQVQMIMDRLDKLATVNDVEKENTKKWLVDDFAKNKMYLPKEEHNKFVYPLAVIEYEQEEKEILQQHNLDTCPEPECVQYRRREAEHKRRMEELKRNHTNRTDKKSKYIFPL